MKKIYSIIGALAICSASFAQEAVLPKTQKVDKAKLVSTMNLSSTSMLAKTATAVSGDTACWQNFADFSPEFAPSGNLSVFGYLGGGYCYGKNHDSLNRCAAGVLNLASTNIVVKKVILWAARKKGTGPAGSVITVRFTDMAANKAYHYLSATSTWTMDAIGPNAVLSTTTVPFSMIDTSSVLPTSPWTIVTFPTPISTNKNFAIDVDCSTLAAGDTVGFVSDAKNDAVGADLTFHKSWFGGTSFTPWMVTDGGAFADGGLDNNIAFFSFFYVGTAVNEYYNGLKLSSVFPNPATTNATINYSLENDSKNISLVVYDLTGKKVFNENYANQAAGNYSVNVNTENLAAGTYYYQVRANNSVLTKELVITK